MYNNGDYYHVYNRGVEKRRIFMCDKDYERFLLSMKEFNTAIPSGSIRDKMKRSQGSNPCKTGVGPLVTIHLISQTSDRHYCIKLFHGQQKPFIILIAHKNLSLVYPAIINMIIFTIFKLDVAHEKKKC